LNSQTNDSTFPSECIAVLVAEPICEAPFDPVRRVGCVKVVKTGKPYMNALTACPEGSNLFSAKNDAMVFMLKDYLMNLYGTKTFI